ncbi:hypothetical protein, partial [Pseudomonas peli]|uniref:hypothetical protein n=1 Tax=Pseudomonas peli TaxID=592361 RepID=UPI0024AD7692
MRARKSWQVGKPTVELADSFGQALLQPITVGVINVTPALSSLASAPGKIKDVVTEAPQKISSGWSSMKSDQQKRRRWWPGWRGGD